MKTPRATIVLIVLFLIFGFGWQLSSQQRITRWAQMLTLESGGQVYELPQVLEPPQHSTFFSLQLSNAPPFPFRPLDFPVYALGDAYVFDDLDFDWVEARALGLSLFGGSSALQKGGQIIAADGPPSPGDGGGGGSTNYPFPSAYGYTNGELYLRINAVALAWADLSLHNSEPTYYQLLSKENLEEEGWTLEQTFLGAAETNVTFISNPTLERPQLFFMARQLPQAIRLNFTNTFVTTNLVPATIEGNPTNFAILVNDTNFASATWATFSNAAITVTLGATNGNYDVWFGYINGTTNWSVTRLVLDSVIPSLVITAPSGSTTSQPTIQLQGYSLESLAGLEYTVTNLDGSTSGAGFVTGQDFNTNTFQATTNWFQCFDVPLAEGTNLVTLQAMDLAGNIFTTNLSYTLDFSGDTTAPAITVGWPQNGATVAAASFTLLGAVNDDTAQVKIMGASSETSGLVERGGNFSAGPLALPFATNLFTIIATDAAGNSSTQQLTLHKSVVELTVNLATNLHETNTTVTGSVSHTNQSVWVNGVQATVYTDGSWIATNVPVSAGGSAVFDVYAGTILNDPSGTELTVTQNKPPLVRVASYKEDFFIRHDVFFHSCSPIHHEFSSHLRKWKRGDGGTGQLHYVRSGLAEATRNETWPVEWPSVQNPLVTAVQINGGTVLNGTDAPFLPWQYSRLSDLETYSSNWECVHYGLRSALRTVDTEVEVVTGEGAGMQTILLTATAAENEDRLLGYTPLPLAEYFDHPGTLPVRASDIQIRGKTLTPNPTNPTMGTLLLQLPANSTNDVTPTVTRYYNQNSYTFDVKAEEVKMEIMEVISDQINGSECNKLPTPFYTGEPNNPMLMATRSGVAAHLAIRMDVSPNIVSNVYAGIRKIGTQTILGSVQAKPFPEKMLLQFNAINGRETYEVVAGYDKNGNDQLDNAEVITVFEKTPRIDSEGKPSVKYLNLVDKIIIVTAGQFATSKSTCVNYNLLFTDYAGDLIKTFALGLTNVPEATVTSGLDLYSTTPKLSHEVGGQWDANCHDTTYRFTFAEGTEASDDFEDSVALSETVDAVIQTNLTVLLAAGGTNWITNSPINFNESRDFVVTEYSGPFDINELGFAFGKVDILGQLEIKYKKIGVGTIEVDSYQIIGSFDDLYDFAFVDERPKEAATVQAGHATLSSTAEPGGKVFFTRLIFLTGWKSLNKTYP